MAFVKPKFGTPCPWNTDNTNWEVIGNVGLSNEDKNIKGFMLIGFSEPAIVQIVSSMFGEEFESINDEIREAAGEIANMISGQARQVLTPMGTRLQAALPSVVSGQNIIVAGAKKIPGIMIPFEVEKGSFDLVICIEGIA